MDDTRAHKIISALADGCDPTTGEKVEGSVLQHGDVIRALHIAVRALVLVTTHDVELQHLLEPNFLTFHFVEDPELPEVFDYRLHPGISTSKNAIKLLEKVGFPAAIIRDARRLADASAAEDKIGRCSNE